MWQVENRLNVQVPYDKSLINELKAIGGGWWNSKKSLELPFGKRE